MITKFIKYNESFDPEIDMELEKEYPIRKKYDLMTITNPYFLGDMEVDSDSIKKLFKRLFLNNFCEFYEYDLKDKIRGVVQEITIEDWPGAGCYFYFVVNDEKRLIDFHRDIIVYLKEEPIIKTNRSVDPYDEEDWDD
jgi:hypothetical protein